MPTAEKLSLKQAIAVIKGGGELYLGWQWWQRLRKVKEFKGYLGNKVKRYLKDKNQEVLLMDWNGKLKGRKASKVTPRVLAFITVWMMLPLTEIEDTRREQVWGWEKGWRSWAVFGHLDLKILHSTQMEFFKKTVEILIQSSEKLFGLDIHIYVSHLQKVVIEVMDMTFPRRKTKEWEESKV